MGGPSPELRRPPAQASRSSRTKMLRPPSSVSLSSAMARCADAASANSTMPHPLDRPSDPAARPATLSLSDPAHARRVSTENRSRGSVDTRTRPQNSLARSISIHGAAAPWILGGQPQRSSRPRLRPPGCPGRSLRGVAPQRPGSGVPAAPSAGTEAAAAPAVVPRGAALQRPAHSTPLLAGPAQASIGPKRKSAALAPKSAGLAALHAGLAALHAGPAQASIGPGFGPGPPARERALGGGA